MTQKGKGANPSVRSVATQLYVHNLKYLRGGESLGKIHKYLFKRDDQNASEFWASHSRRFYKNAKGMEIKDRRLISIIEAKIPGSQYIFDHPLWIILANPFANINELRDLMLLLPPELQVRLFDKRSTTGQLNRKVWRDTRHLKLIGLENNFDALACLLMLLREAELNHNWHWYILIKWETYELFLRLAYFDPLRPLADRLNQLISRGFIDRNNPLPDRILKQLYDFEIPFFRSIKSLNTVYFNNDFYSGLLWHAESMGMTSASKADQLTFLFWAHFYGINKIEKLLKHPDSSDETQNTFNNLVESCKAKNITHKLSGGLIIQRKFD